jgi:hypothetical protein
MESSVSTGGKTSGGTSGTIPRDSLTITVIDSLLSGVLSPRRKPSNRNAMTKMNTKPNNNPIFTSEAMTKFPFEKHISIADIL